MLAKNIFKNSGYLTRNILLIPGPITTSNRTKEALNLDIASRQHDFIDVIKSVNSKMLDIAKVSSKNYACIPIQGCGTYANESVLGTISNNSKLTILSNGVYGERLYEISNILNLNSKKIECNNREKITIKNIENNLPIDKNNNNYIAFAHHETSNGIENNIEELTDYAKYKNNKVIVDGISSFGGIPIEIEKLDIDYFVTSSNKCLHGLPGVSFVIAKKKTIEESKNNRKSHSLDLYDQYKDFEHNGQFRFTPPPQIINSLDIALDELIEQGGVEERYKRYRFYNDTLRSFLRYEGLKPCVLKQHQGPICVLFEYPWKEFDFNELYLRLLSKNIIIYSAQIAGQDVFRLGNIGDISESEFKYCLLQIGSEIKNMYKEYLDSSY